MPNGNLVAQDMENVDKGHHNPGWEEFDWCNHIIHRHPTSSSNVLHDLFGSIAITMMNTMVLDSDTGAPWTVINIAATSEYEVARRNSVAVWLPSTLRAGSRLEEGPIWRDTTCAAVEESIFSEGADLSKASLALGTNLCDFEPLYPQPTSTKNLDWLLSHPPGPRDPQQCGQTPPLSLALLAQYRTLQ